MQPRPHSKKLPVLLLTGFLGSGKTTLLNALLADGIKTAVIINEFGETPIDHALLKRQDLPMTVLSGGCLCCQIKGALTPTLKNLWMAWNQASIKPFERIIIETSGVASPEPILDTLLRERWVSGHYQLQKVITTVSALSAADQLARYAEAQSQVAWSDLILLTHADQTDAATVLALNTTLTTLAPSTPTQRLPFPYGLADLAPSSNPRFRPLPKPLPADPDRFRSVSLILQAGVTLARVESALQAVLQQHGHCILRIKALIHDTSQNRFFALHAADGRLYPAAALNTVATDNRLVVIVDSALDDITDDLKRMLSDLI
ncbi:MAG: GTP-binding protein [Methylomonas sp.]|nr:GTP-binding protein [Methylomonas sp.]PPD22136.1 MAG: GTP-binding protein [Methylomonas sp.]